MWEGKAKLAVSCRATRPPYWYEEGRTGLTMTSRTAALRRGPEDPQQVTFLELFSDMVFVFALFQLLQGLLEHLGWSGAFQTAVLLLAMWLVWNHTAGISDRYDPRRPAIQLPVIRTNVRCLRAGGRGA
jgi:hypothetical protein